jgi:cytochrome P450
MGLPRLWWRTRHARGRRDAGAALRAIARGAQDAVGLRLRGQHILLLLDPELAGQLLSGHAADTIKGPGVQRTRALLGDGLLTSEGASHDRARRLVAPGFSPRRLDRYTATFAHLTQTRMAGWRDGQQMDMHAEMAALTLEIVGQSLLGIDLSPQAARVRADLEATLSEFADSQAALPGLGRLRFPPARRPVSARRAAPAPRAAPQAAIHQLVDDISEQRRKNPAADRGDVISALLAATAEPGGLTDGEVHDHVITLMMAGHETTASALAWTLHLLGRHQDVQRRLQAEVDTLGGRPPGFGDLAALRYTRAVISEAIRLYPPAWLIGRTTTADLKLGGWQLPAGSIAAVSPLLLHHDPRWFPDPVTFDPGRWLDPGRQAAPRHAYLPFGTGPRACIGEQFAWAEATTVLAVLAQTWAFGAVPGFRATVQYRVTLRPAAGLPVLLHARGGAPAERVLRPVHLRRAVDRGGTG